MKLTFPLVAGLALAGAVSTAAISQGGVDRALARAIDARQSHMTLYSFNLGLLGDMAKGDVEYDADAASAAASNLAALGGIDESRYWLAGTDTETLGKDQTRALAKIWEDEAGFNEDMQALADASTAMAEAAGGGVESLRGAMGSLGAACGACHEDYRAER